MVIPTARPLTRILGLGFGLAIAFGGTVGVGILRLPGTLAAALGDSRLIILFWVLGGCMPCSARWPSPNSRPCCPRQAGSMSMRGGRSATARVRRRLERLGQPGRLDFLRVADGVGFLGTLWPATAGAPRAVAIAVIGVFTALHWAGLRMGSMLTNLISLTVGLMLLVLVWVAICRRPSRVHGATVDCLRRLASLDVLCDARSRGDGAALVFVTYDGWYSPIYLAEESTQPTLTLPRAIIGGTLLIAAMYVLINLAILRVLPLPVLADRRCRRPTPRGCSAAGRRAAGDRDFADDGVEPGQRHAADDAANSARHRPRRILYPQGRERQRKRHPRVALA